MRGAWLLVCIGAVIHSLPSVGSAGEDQWTALGLIREHIPYFFYNNPAMKKACEQDAECPYKDLLPVRRCWGYEKDCRPELRMSPVHCPDSSQQWAKTKEQQRQMFWEAADFGNIHLRKSTLKTFCEPLEKGDTYLACSDDTRYCIGRNIYIDLSKAGLGRGSKRYRGDTLREEGLIGGKCKLNKYLLNKEGDHKSFLQSWGEELEFFTQFDFHPIKDKKCDVVFEKPTVLHKLDAGINMYHHFCDFVNLYMSQHINNSFSKDIDIINWDTMGSGQYYDLFNSTWDAFTSNPVLMLNAYAGKKVCFKDVMFPLLARQRRGLFYNTPIIPGCYGTNLFRAFSQHVLHRLHVEQEGPLETKIRITLLVRKTKFRKILNEAELTQALKTVGEYEVKVIDYWREILDFLDEYKIFDKILSRRVKCLDQPGSIPCKPKNVPFVEQLAITHNSDVFMGMHGAGLTHFLFQPDWGASFEIYNCEDAMCYKDLARLRGTKYFTWENTNKLEQEDEGHHPQLGAHAKFTNYAFDVSEFMKMVAKTVAHVRSHPAFLAARAAKYGHQAASASKDEL